MKVREILEKVRSGEIILEYAGHNIGLDAEYLLERYDECVELENGSYDGKWSSCKNEGITPEEIEKRNADMRDFYKRHLDYEVEQEDTLRWGGVHDARTCSGCGQSLHWTLTGDKLQLRNYYEESTKHKRGHDWVNHPVDYVCPYKNPKPFFGEISIDSNLLVANFFRVEDAPEGKKYHEEYSLGTLAGRENITKYKAGTNIAYGQMGNMSIGVYVNKDKESVIIGPSSHPAEYGDYETDEEYELAMDKPVFEGYDLVGTVCLDVWRWEATDIKTIERHGIDIEAFKEDNKYRDYVDLDVKHGTWTFQHNYHIDDENNHVYAILKLKKDNS